MLYLPCKHSSYGHGHSTNGIVRHVHVYTITQAINIPCGIYIELVNVVSLSRARILFYSSTAKAK